MGLVTGYFILVACDFGCFDNRHRICIYRQKTLGVIHLFRYPLAHSDLFIREITDTHISYEIREKENGALLGAPLVSGYEVRGDEVWFDTRLLPLPLVVHIRATLEDRVG